MTGMSDKSLDATVTDGLNEVGRYSGMCKKRVAARMEFGLNIDDAGGSSGYRHMCSLLESVRCVSLFCLMLLRSLCKPKESEDYWLTIVQTAIGHEE